MKLLKQDWEGQRSYNRGDRGRGQSHGTDWRGDASAQHSYAPCGNLRSRLHTGSFISHVSNGCPHQMISADDDLKHGLARYHICLLILSLFGKCVIIENSL